MNKKILGVLVCVLVAVSVIGVFQWKSAKWKNDKTQNTLEQTDIDGTDIDSYAAAVQNEINDTEKTVTESPANYPARVVDGLLVIGAPDAPVTITEFSSLSCPHCAAFHANTLASLKTDYIDTGKVQFVFMDFPLNQQALHGTMLLRCVDASQRYELMELLFKQQSQWAFEGNHQTKLKQYAALLGLSNEKADQCMNDTKVEKEILMGMKAASTEFNIASTPTFLVQPSRKIITGAPVYGAFSTEIEAILNQ